MLNGSSGRLIGLMELHSSLPLKKYESRFCTLGCTMVSRDTSNVPPLRSKMRKFFSTVAPFLSLAVCTYTHNNKVRVL